MVLRAQISSGDVSPLGPTNSRRPNIWQSLTAVMIVLAVAVGYLMFELGTDRQRARHAPDGPVIALLAHTAATSSDADRAQRLDEMAHFLVSNEAAVSVRLTLPNGQVISDVSRLPRHGFVATKPLDVPVHWRTGEVTARLVLASPAGVDAVRDKVALLQVLALVMLGVMAVGLVLTRRQHLLQQRAIYLDPLTGAGNRRFLDRVAARRFRRDDVDVRHGVLLVDIDGFKQVNDTRGHAAGDRQLQHVASAFQEITRPTDEVVRLGGDEFAVLLVDLPPDEPEAHVASVLERARTALPEVGLSAGAAIYPRDGNDVVELLEKADAAMYENKRRRKRGATRAPETARVPT